MSDGTDVLTALRRELTHTVGHEVYRATLRVLAGRRLEPVGPSPAAWAPSALSTPVSSVAVTIVADGGRHHVRAAAIDDAGGIVQYPIVAPGVAYGQAVAQSDLDIAVLNASGDPTIECVLETIGATIDRSVALRRGIVTGSWDHVHVCGERIEAGTHVAVYR